MNETEINEMSIKCPACNTENTAKSIMKEIEIPHFGKVLETTIICESCGFKHSDIIALEQNDPAKYILKIIYPPELSDHSQQLCPFQKLVLKWNPVQNQKDM